jgi:hypothetical protein
MHVSLNKQLISIQICFGDLSSLCQVKGHKMISHFRCLRGQNNIGSRATFRTRGTVWSAVVKTFNVLSICEKTTEICRSKEITCLHHRLHMVALQYSKFSGHVTTRSGVSFVQFHTLVKWISLNFCTLTTSTEICVHMAALRINGCTIITIRNVSPQRREYDHAYRHCHHEVRIYHHK